MVDLLKPVDTLEERPIESLGPIWVSILGAEGTRFMLEGPAGNTMLWKHTPVPRRSSKTHRIVRNDVTISLIVSFH